MDEFDREGYQIFATTRTSSMDQLKEIVRDRPHIIPLALNVTLPDQATELVGWIEKTQGPVDILINNAGVSYRTVVEEMTPEDELVQMATNYLGPMHLIRLVLPAMRRRRTGHIINISSVGGMMAMPTMSSYSASKFALEGATESLWYELRPFNVKISLVRPGFINSNSFRKVLYSKKASLTNSANPYYPHYRYMTAFIEKLMTRTPCTPESVARTIYKISRMKHPPLRIAGTPDAWFFSYIRRVLPRRFYHWLLYRSLPGIKTWGKGKDDE